MIARPVRTLLAASRAVAVAWTLWPTVVVLADSATDTEATGVGPGFTAVTVKVALPLTFAVDALICAVPAASAVTVPALDTVATALLLDVHDTERFIGEPVASRTNALAVTVCPTVALAALSATEMLATLPRLLSSRSAMVVVSELHELPSSMTNRVAAMDMDLFIINTR